MGFAGMGKNQRNRNGWKDRDLISSFEAFSEAESSSSQTLEEEELNKRG